MSGYNPENRRCGFCGHRGLSACITNIHAAKCHRYEGPSFRYSWHHLPSGKQGETAQAFSSRTTFEHELANWNRSADWVYRAL